VKTGFFDIALLIPVTQNSSEGMPVRKAPFKKTFVTGFVPWCLCGCGVRSFLTAYARLILPRRTATSRSARISARWCWPR